MATGDRIRIFKLPLHQKFYIRSCPFRWIVVRKRTRSLYHYQTLNAYQTAKAGRGMPGLVCIRGRIQRKTWCKGPYARVGYKLTCVHSRVDSSTFTMGIGQPYARVDLNPILESTLSPQSGTTDLASSYMLEFWCSQRGNIHQQPFKMVLTKKTLCFTSLYSMVCRTFEIFCEVPPF